MEMPDFRRLELLLSVQLLVSFEFSKVLTPIRVLR